MSNFSDFSVLRVFWIFLHKEKGFERREGVIRDQREKTNQNMYKKKQQKNFAWILH